MSWKNEHEYAPEEDTLVPLPRQPEPEHPKARHVLETMKNLIVEIQSFKEGNEQLKMNQEK